MRLDETVTRSTIPSPVKQTGETGMMQRERWEEVRRLFYQERMRIREIARCLDLEYSQALYPVGELAAVLARGARRHIVRGARRFSASACSAGQLLGAHPVPGA
jgi:hypothetical protein